MAQGRHFILQCECPLWRNSGHRTLAADLGNRGGWKWSGGRTRTRTLDPLIKSQLLYQLSYAPGSPLAAGAAKPGCLSKGRPRCPAWPPVPSAGNPMKKPPGRARRHGRRFGSRRGNASLATAGFWSGPLIAGWGRDLPRRSDGRAHRDGGSSRCGRARRGGRASRDGRSRTARRGAPAP